MRAIINNYCTITFFASPPKERLFMKEEQIKVNTPVNDDKSPKNKLEQYTENTENMTQSNESQVEASLAKEALAIEEQAKVLKDSEIIDKNASQASCLPEDIKNLEKKVKSLKGFSTFLSIVLIATIAASGFGGYYLYEIKGLQENYNNSLNLINKTEKNIKQLEQESLNTKNEFSVLIAENNNILDSNKDLSAKVQAFQDEVARLSTSVNNRLTQYESRDPDAWRKAHSYFLVSSAYRMAIFSKDTKAAVNCLESADKLLIDIEEKSINNIRKALSNDIMALNSIPTIDLRGLINKIDAVYSNLNNLPLKEVTTPEQRAASYKKEANISENIKQWSSNLLESLKDFSSRFIEIRRRDEGATFLSADQGKLLLENLRSQLSLAKQAVYEKDETGYRNDIEQVITLIKAYYNSESPVYKATLNTLEDIKSATVDVTVPDTLESYNLFNQYYARQTNRDSLNGSESTVTKE